jgi:hypothetical protein
MRVMPHQSVLAFASLTPDTRTRKGEAWWAVTDSNRRHSACKADATAFHSRSFHNTKR